MDRLVPALDWLKRNRWHVRFGCCFLLVLWLQSGFVASKILVLDPAQYAELATDLQVNARWRYGYVKQHHGAILVQTENTAQSLAWPVDRDANDTVEQRTRSIMFRELQWCPIKAELENLLYIVLLAWAFYGKPLITSRLTAGTLGRRGEFYAHALSWAVGWSIACFPLLVADYGAPLYSTWNGPGALSSSGPSLGAYFGNGMTVSYRYFIQLVAFFPSILASALNGCVRIPSVLASKLLSYLSGVLFYSASGMLLHVAKNR
jgi:hypothetical protein